MHQPLLLEIGVEELPAIPLLSELENIPQKYRTLLDEHELGCEFEFYYTPRRLVFFHPNFPKKQSDKTETLYGPPVAIAYKDGIPTKAAESFAKKTGMALEALGRTEQKGKEVLCATKEVVGKPASELLGTIVEALLQKLAFGKAMRWGDRDDSFIRPIRWIVALLDNEVVPFEVFGVKSGRETYAHRSVSYELQNIPTPENYADFLQKRGIMLSQERRRSKIIEDFQRLEQEEEIVIEIDHALLNEVIAITEAPTPLLGSFDEKFLVLPKEVITTSMISHQRYFPVYKEGAITNQFVVVSNSLADDPSKIISGNEKVLRARLEDALFFWNNDLKKGLSSDGLASVSFAQGLGSLSDKTWREHAIASRLQYDIESDDDLYGKVYTAVQLSKTDLLTEMVYEFTELQGVMGYYYAKAQGENEEVALAIKEQYLPVGEDSELPTTDTGAVLALATKFDTLMGLFSTGKIPSGSKDPFALRRAASGIIRIILERQYRFSLKALLKNFSKQYHEFDLEKLEQFFYDRLLQILNINPSLLRAVLATGEDDFVAIAQKSAVLIQFTAREDFETLASTFKRVANITKDFDLETISIDPAKFESDEERVLYERFNGIKETEPSALLEALAGLKPELDRFFDGVMVNAEDEAVRHNRKSLIGSIYNAFKAVGDLKEITV